jgi:hypothetical protein
MYITGTGTIVNVIAVTIGCAIGLFFKKFITEGLQKALMSALSLATFSVGIVGVVTSSVSISDSSLSGSYTLLMILSLIIGTAIGTFINIEHKLDLFGEFCQRKLAGGSENSTFAQGFVSASLVFCVGSMAIVGSLNDGIAHDPTILFAKSALDCIIAIVFTSTLGIGTLLSVVTLIVYQGSITLLASLISPYLTNEVVSQMSFIGNVLIMGIGLNFVYEPKFKVGNMLPSVFVPFVYFIVKSMFV